MRLPGRALRVAGSVLLLAVSACTSGGDDEPAVTTTTSRSEPDRIIEGGTLRLGLGAPLRPDPTTASLGSPSDLMVLDLLHDGLTAIAPGAGSDDSSGGADGGEPVPALATSWTPNAELTAWTFALDPEATFGGGRPITSADVVASLERVAKGGDTSLAALRLEAVRGFRAFVDGAAPRLEGLVAPDPVTVQVVLDTPLSALPAILASPVFGVVDVAALDAIAPTADPTGAVEPRSLASLGLSGQWLVEDGSADTLTLDRRQDAPGHLDQIELHVHDDPEAAYDAFDAGDLDWALVPVERYGDAIRAHGDDAFAPFHAELFFGMRVTSPTLANVELRKAIAAAIDREAIVRAVYADLADPLSTVVPQGVPGYDDGRCPECGHDPDRARTLLAGAFPEGQVPTVAIDFDESPAQEAMARIVADDLQAVGIPSQLRPKPLEEYKRFVVAGGQELFSFGWIGGYMSPDAYLAPLFSSASNDNLTGYGAAGVDAALVTARATADQAAARTQWGYAEAQVLAEAAVVPIAQFRTQAVVGERVRALRHAVDGSVDWSAVWVVDGA